MRGYIKLHRQLLDNELFTSEPFSKGQAWITILLLANHKESFITTKNGKLIKIKRGECGYSELALSKIFKWSRGKVKRFLMLLESEKMIQQKISENHSVIKVLNYEQYQDDTINSTINGQQTGQQTDTNNNDKNDKNVISLYQKQITEREREILKSYCKRHKVQNVNAYISAVIKNGDYIQLIEEEKEYQCKIQKYKEVIEKQKIVETEDPELTEQAYKRAHERMLEFRRRK